MSLQSNEHSHRQLPLREEPLLLSLADLNRDALPLAGGKPPNLS